MMNLGYFLVLLFTLCFFYKRVMKEFKALYESLSQELELEKQQLNLLKAQDPAHIVCKCCGLTVARYNNDGVCANCEVK